MHASSTDNPKDCRGLQEFIDCLSLLMPLDKDTATLAQEKQAREQTLKTRERLMARASTMAVAPVVPDVPKTSTDELKAIVNKFRANHAAELQGCRTFIDKPPKDRGERDKQHLRLTATIMAKVVLPMDAVDVSHNDHARGLRKALLKEFQGIMEQMDVMKQCVERNEHLGGAGDDGIA